MAARKRRRGSASPGPRVAREERRTVGRNDPCPCGSGRKFKQCCAGKAESRSRLGLYAVLVVLVAIAGVIAYTFTSGGSGPRQVWDPEHGHYHTVP